MFVLVDVVYAQLEQLWKSDTHVYRGKGDTLVPDTERPQNIFEADDSDDEDAESPDPDALLHLLAEDLEDGDHGMQSDVSDLEPDDD